MKVEAGSLLRDAFTLPDRAPFERRYRLLAPHMGAIALKVKPKPPESVKGGLTRKSLRLP